MLAGDVTPVSAAVSASCKPVLAAGLFLQLATTVAVQLVVGEEASVMKGWGLRGNRGGGSVGGGGEGGLVARGCGSDVNY